MKDNPRKAMQMHLQRQERIIPPNARLARNYAKHGNNKIGNA